MAKADLRKAENWRESGEAIKQTRELSGLNLDEFADALGKDQRQITRWEKAEERPQLETVYASKRLRPFLVIAMAKGAGVDVEVETVIRVKRIA